MTKLKSLYFKRPNLFMTDIMMRATIIWAMVRVFPKGNLYMDITALLKKVMLTEMTPAGGVVRGARATGAANRIRERRGSPGRLGCG